MSSKVWPFLKKNFLPLGLVTAATVAMVYPPPGREVQKHMVEVNGNDYKLVSSCLIFLIFLSSGFTLKTDDIMKAAKNYVAVGYGFVAILLITPTLGFGIMKLPFKPKAFASGLSVFCAVPTTLSSGVALVTQGGGNAALALLLTVGTNLLGILTVPFAVKLVLDSEEDFDFDALSLLIKLAITILAPLILGKLLRHSHQALGKFAKEKKQKFSMANSLCLVLIVWQTLSKAQPEVIDQSAGDLLLLVAGGIGIHIAFLVFNFISVSLLRVEQPEYRALLLCTSQKTLPIAVTVINFLPEPYEGYHGLLVVPCVVSHLVQILIDSVIVSRWMGGVESGMGKGGRKRSSDRKSKRSDSRMNLVGLVETASSLKEQKIDPMQTSFDGRVGVKAPLPQDHPLRDKVSTEFRDRETSRVENGGTKPVEIQIELVDILREDKGDGE
ncbi:putative sodium/metabolite cotransporter [Chloropicon primus]|uniref:Putative sodium/metabolite cotransporter n=1 Tax=Chloropicon primus TaxID=1764295 RepID=A0A5B8MCM7_9CHLO|nr:putative sodium/metabolite cotransporter [Chloropicon primus]|eukprot:QDZ18246.1 putative sodium/metabolite cotransporter [Chloropicon primus]